jgi:hypothetical protein
MGDGGVKGGSGAPTGVVNDGEQEENKGGAGNGSCTLPVLEIEKEPGEGAHNRGAKGRDTTGSTAIGTTGIGRDRRGKELRRGKSGTGHGGGVVDGKQRGR